ncbi:hypothetical protein [Bacillus toyonensis]|uniref:hypothetical protein n=1 Tax=Bacillus toyonensis TaxID=155322 RepID=UPI002E245B3B|nr:hypothetical protein [Bacillus toyonensis]
MANRYKFTLIQDKNEHLKSWRVTDFVDKISFLNYKKEIINEIHRLLDNGVKSHQIIIFDKSFSIHKRYEYLGKHNLKSETGVKNLYHLGKPISLYPNKRVYAIYNVFEVFSKLYTAFNAEGIILKKDELHEFINEAIDNITNENISIEKLKKYINVSLKRVKDKKRYETLNKKCEDLFERLEKKNIKVNNEIDEYILMENLLKDNSLKESTLEKQERYNHLKKKYIDKFGSLFINSTRPIVAVINEELNRIDILGVNFIKRNSFDERQVDLKEVKHNSPFTICFFAGYALLNLIHQVYANKLDKQKLEDDYSDEELEDLEAEYADENDILENDSTNNADELRIQVIENWKKTKLELESIMQEQEQEQELVASTVIQNSLVSIETKIEGALQKNFEANGFMNGTLGVEIAD